MGALEGGREREGEGQKGGKREEGRGKREGGRERGGRGEGGGREKDIEVCRTINESHLLP